MSTAWRFRARMAGPAWRRSSPAKDSIWQRLRADLDHRLARYARPLFLRIRHEMEVTGTFKYTKTDLVSQGFDPAAIADDLYFNHPEQEAFVRLDKALYHSIHAGQIRP